MRLVDELLEDEQLLDTVYEAQGERYPRAASGAGCKRRGSIVAPAVVEAHPELEL